MAGIASKCPVLVVEDDPSIRSLIASVTAPPAPFDDCGERR